MAQMIGSGEIDKRYTEGQLHTLEELLWSLRDAANEVRTFAREYEYP